VTKLAGDPIRELREDIGQLVGDLRAAGVPRKLLESIARKSLKTPRRQTGRVDRRTNRHLRWSVSPDHPDYSSERDAHLVLLRLLIDLVAMRSAPDIGGDRIAELSRKYFDGTTAGRATSDPLTGEILDYRGLVQDIVEKPQHGYSKFHIGHQDPRSHPKHLPGNVRWQLKTSNDFQGRMDVRVARIALRIDELTRNPSGGAVEEIAGALTQLYRDLDIPLTSRRDTTRY
jgi:hypothetical protein